MAVSPRKLVPLLALFALAVILLIASVTETRRERVQVAPKPRDGSGFEELTKEFATQSVETRRASEAVADTPPAQSPAASSQTGRLRLHVTDAATGAPLAGATCVVYAERDGPVTYGKLSTDSDGRASIDALPENTILVQVERNPPHANAYAGVWLRDGETRDLEVKVGAGGVIVGRAVDDAGQVLADVEVFLGREVAKEQLPETRTSTDGRFEVSCVASKPISVWIVDDAMRPGSWEPVCLRFSKNDTTTWATIKLEDGHRLDIGDVVLERPSRLAGRLLDARRNPIGNALIGWGTSPDQLRREVLSSRNKPQSSGERKDRTRTLADGSFEMAIRPSFPHLVAATSEGITQWFPVTKVVAGASRSDLELILDDVTILELELVDERGARITKPRNSPALQSVNSAAGSGDRIKIALVLEDGSQQSNSQSVDDDGLFRIQSAGVNKKRSLRVNFPGYLPVSMELEAASGLVDRRRITLRERPSLLAHLKVLAPKHATAAGKNVPQVQLRACVLGATEIMDTIRAGGLECCGLGSKLYTPLTALDRAVELPVSSERERYWLHVLVLQWQPSVSPRGEFIVLHESHTGPFGPGSTIHEIEIPSLDPGNPPAKAEEAPPPPAVPSNEIVKSNERRDAKVWKTRLRFEEANGLPVPPDTSFTVYSSPADGESAPGGRLLDESGTAGFEVELTGRAAIQVRERKDDPVIGSMYTVQVIEVSAIESYGSRPIVLAPWCAVDIVVRGDATALLEAALQAQLVMLDSPALLPASRSILGTREAAPLPDQSRRFRAWAAPGKYEIRLKSGLFTAPRTEVEVRNTNALQVFELSSTRR